MKLAHRYHDLGIKKMAETAKAIDAMMALTNLTGTVSANMLNQITTTGLFLSIHTGNGATVGQSGATEILGSTMIGYSAGGYTGARKSVAWNAAGTDGIVETNTQQTFALLAAQASGILGWGLWTTDGTSAGTFLFGGSTTGLTGSIPNAANVVFAAGGIVLTISG
jgi:ELWxxDGT repeat protein